MGGERTRSRRSHKLRKRLTKFGSSEERNPELATTPGWRAAMVRARTTRHLSQQEIAERVGTSQNIISLIESGGIEASRFICGICRTLGIGLPLLEDILDGQPSEAGLLAHHALTRDISRRLQLSSHDELRVLDRVLLRLELGRERHGQLELSRRDQRRKRRDELLDDLVRQVGEELAAEDIQRAELREAARREMLGEATP